MSLSNWSAALATVEQSVARFLEATQAREQTVQAALAETQAVETTCGSWQQQLNQCAERIQQMQALALQAESQAAALDQTLAEGEQTLRRWLDTATTARQQLAERLGRAVG